MSYHQIGNYQIKIVRKSKNKNTYLRVENDGSITINSPYHLEEELLLQYAQQFITKLEKKYDVDKLNKVSFSDNGTFYYLGKPYLVKVIHAQNNQVYIDDDNIIIKTKDLAKPYISKLVDNFLKIQANLILRKEFLRVVEYFHDIDFIPELKISKMKSRFGACFYKKNLVTLSTLLLHYDYECIEYVIVHELAHFIQPNHSKKFYYVIEKYLPNYKQAELKLKNRLDK